jgi:uncharacterized protein with HEPN domain
MTEVFDYLDDIIEAGEKIERFTDGMSYEEFIEDQKTVDAVLRNFEVIGEAAKNVPERSRREYSHVPWSEMAGMRDELIHGYATVDLRIVRTTVQEEIRSLTVEIKTLRDELDDE